MSSIILLSDATVWTSLTDEPRVVINNCKMFIIEVTGVIVVKLLSGRTQIG